MASATSMTLSLFHAVTLSGLYVGSLYMWKGSLAKSRNDPSQIRKRTISVLTSTIVSIFYCGMVYLLSNNSNDTTHNSSESISSSESLGFSAMMGIDFFRIFSQIFAVIAVLLLNSCLFLGPIAEALNVESITSMSEVTQFLQKSVQYLYMEFIELCYCLFEILKQYPKFLMDEENVIKYEPNGIDKSEEAIFSFRSIIIGPITEEVVFRSCLYYILHYFGGFSMMTSLLVSAALFGVAHCHHIIEHVLHGDMEIRTAILNVTVQLTYTFVFGLYCGYIYGKTKSIIAAIVLHAYCNLMGLPSFNMSRPVLAGAYVIGLVLFRVLLFPVLSVF
ncbi:hypothetical protein C9374_004634 [Naegleria lovaniensis]|uniref:intramembrane prenyl-peptidase Rce1 n=1 Tax=Naegleria lovaniensis TaxID=51637 RepID=A0AA88KJJ5_NAELO|nr:uncharacterized protein C9374_004634 [Naegleria lovaniensis]KAG2383297.1 hypothetical protein C9374_004634 [Naegleria lovaniensis]